MSTQSKAQTGKKVTAPALVARKAAREGAAPSLDPILCLTAYDYTLATLAEAAQVDVVLVGDSLGNVVQGHDTTLPVTLEQMIYHTQCVRRGLKTPLLVMDMPFGTFQVSVEQTVRNCLRAVQEGGAEAVKVEGSTPHILDAIRQLVESGVPVMGHLGLTPQSVHGLGGFRRQARTPDAAARLMADAELLQNAGVFALVLECIPADVADRVTRMLKIPTIGIGAGETCDGQILVMHDLIGLRLDKPPSFVPQRAHIGETAVEAIRQWADSYRQPLREVVGASKG